MAGALAAAGTIAFGIGAVSAQTVDCMAPPPSDQDLTLIAAYAASPPAVDEIAFTMETENIMYNTYGGDLLQYVSVWYPEYNTCGAGVNQEGNCRSFLPRIELHSPNQATASSVDHAVEAPPSAKSVLDGGGESGCAAAQVLTLQDVEDRQGCGAA